MHVFHNDFIKQQEAWSLNGVQLSSIYNLHVLLIHVTLPLWPPMSLHAYFWWCSCTFHSQSFQHHPQSWRSERCVLCVPRRGLSVARSHEYSLASDPEKHVTLTPVDLNLYYLLNIWNNWHFLCFRKKSLLLSKAAFIWAKIVILWIIVTI